MTLVGKAQLPQITSTSPSASYGLREFACANERHPLDVRMKVGSERKVASSDNFAKFRQSSPNFGVDEIGH